MARNSADRRSTSTAVFGEATQGVVPATWLQRLTYGRARKYDARVDAGCTRKTLSQDVAFSCQDRSAVRRASVAPSANSRECLLAHTGLVAHAISERPAPGHSMERTRPPHLYGCLPFHNKMRRHGLERRQTLPRQVGGSAISASNPHDVRGSPQRSYKFSRSTPLRVPDVNVPRRFHDRLAAWLEAAVACEGPQGRLQSLSVPAVSPQRPTYYLVGLHAARCLRDGKADFSKRGCQRPVRKGVGLSGRGVGDVFPRT